ncbi:peptide ABC transporter substrate-binding protein [Candidatus Similichlamydia epinepheli]|uniref:peptide ABC transporter substrate-binding protein n=1 Tax=Candidatus Similichlamydia epinepheli TaxID=1903953 RepID=UPI001300A450|nr:peptide ABC transporter substrate-binding protein [Candidatus Similichlamydia epinepheli]
MTAHDFVRSWRNAIVSGDGRICLKSTYFDFFLGVEDFRNGKSSWSDVSIRAEDDNTLLFTLKHPVPYFKDLLTLPVFYPVYPNHGVDDELITNGPFFLKGSRWGESLILQKNPFYWDSDSVHFSQIRFIFVESEETQTLLFESGEIDCIGGGLAPLPQEEVNRLLPSGCVSDEYDVLAVHFLNLNTNLPPFSSAKIRLAFSMAISREEICREILKRSLPAYSYLPPSICSRKGVHLIQENSQLAKQLLEDGLQELGMSMKDLGELSLVCSSRGAKMAQALQRIWAEKLGVSVGIETMELKSILSRLTEGDFHISINCIAASYRDPYAFFGIFAQSDFENSWSSWRSETIRNLFHLGFELDSDERVAHIELMEDFFLSEMPLIPIAFRREVCVMQPGLKGVQLSDMLLIDFSRSYWD